MKQVIAACKTIHAYILKHKIFLLLIGFYYLNILGIYVLNGNYVCRENICGVGIAATLFHDPIWHSALAAVAFNSWPFQMPVYSGTTIHGYHFLFDFLLSLISKQGFPPLFAYYKIVPNLYFIPFVYLAFYYAMKISQKLIFVFAYIFFIFFGGTLSYVAFFIHNGKVIGAHDMLLQLNTLGLSPNVGFSFIILLAVMIITLNKDLTLKDHLILGVCLFLEMGMKFYGGLVLFIFLSLYNLIFLLRKKTLTQFITNLLLYGIAFAVAAIVFYDPFTNLKSGFIFIFSPFAMVHSMIESPEYYTMPKLVLTRYTLYASHQFSPRLLLIEVFSTGIFLFHYLGTFNIGFIYVVYSLIKRTITRLEFIILACALFTIAMPVFFIQRGYYYDTMQFLFYSMFFMTYFTAQTFTLIMGWKKPFSFVFLGLILLLTIPNNITAMTLPFKNQRIIPVDEIEALTYLKKQDPGAIAAYPIPDSAYISLFSFKPTYIADTQQLDVTGIDYRERKNQINNLDKINAPNLLVTYYYILKKEPKSKKIIRQLNSEKLRKIYENKSVVVYKKN